ncbi:MAG: tyrosine-type recombinase/integrase [Bacillota bacterium]|nr:tyrosine-type recombinase/integrase [Bacillota bacterium]
MPKNRISKGSDGRWSYCVTDSTGQKHHLRSRRNETKTAFSKRCDQLDTLSERQVTQETLNALFERWIHDYVEPRRSKAYLSSMQHHYNAHVKPHIGNRKITDITRADIYGLLAKAQRENYSHSTIQKIRTCISGPYNWAIDSLGYNLIAPTQGLVYKHVEKPDTQGQKSRVITPDDLQRIFQAAAGSKYEQYFRIIAATGLRPSEALGLQIQDIHPDHLAIRRAVTIHGLGSLKNASSYREIPMHQELQKALLKQRELIAFTTNEGWLFPASAGYPSMNALKAAFKRILAQTEEWETGGRNGLKKLHSLIPPVEASLYDFRHTFATRCAEKGMLPTALKSILGHKDITTTLSYYVELTDDMIEQAVKLLEVMNI